ncbi:histidine kinase dimerization/phosphoacceptor domain -containing protein [Sphingomonas sp.]|uniref:sensor histidine kinase n=1 Tax=Sphingomonas sp. TaxID=28214 RepID=UPI00286B2943|nr:histidine kinase dimerization/phosphoacceptor domain -containing protein [Sphingomonas sp.]
MKAAHHPYEPARLAALRAYDILDTPRESDFDEIVMLASRICEAPISVINLIDENRQWFKAETGLGVRETPLETSICAHVILEEEFVEIPDTRADRRMADNPLCLDEPGLRFYAGALLKSKDGYPIGSLCVLDHHPRTLNALQRDALRILADQVMTQLDLRAVIAAEKVLRSEIDHRVKNSLQVVGAFVSLERRVSENDDARASLERVAQQIHTVAALHDQLAISGTIEQVDLGPYLKQVVHLIDQSLSGDVAVTGTFEPIEVSPREASIVATIVNELAANAVKHSLRMASGTVRFGGERVGGGGYRLMCSDDAGHGADEEDAAAPSGRTGLGLKILQASVRQLGGTMAAGRDDAGYSTRIEFNFSDK